MSESPAKRSRVRLFTLIAIPLVVIAGGLTYAHQSGGHGGHMRGERLEHHLDHLASILTRVGASDAQKTQIDGILRGAFTEMKSAHEAHDQALGQLHQILLAPSIDRTKMELLRAEQIKSLDAASKRLATAFGDAAEVLSPEQRTALGEEVRRHHAH
jgi:periplasmic protein CpxP/Spy